MAAAKDPKAKWAKFYATIAAKKAAKATEAARPLTDQERSDLACDRAAAKRHPMFRDRY